MNLHDHSFLLLPPAESLDIITRETMLEGYVQAHGQATHPRINGATRPGQAIQCRVQGLPKPPLVHSQSDPAAPTLDWADRRCSLRLFKFAHAAEHCSALGCSGGVSGSKRVVPGTSEIALLQAGCPWKGRRPVADCQRSWISTAEQGRASPVVVFRIRAVKLA